MAAPRVITRTQCLLARGIITARISSSILASTRTAFPRRQFTSSVRVWQNNVGTSAQGHETRVSDSPASPNAYERSIALLALPRRAVKSDIEALLRKKGCDVKRIQIRMDRFTFHNEAMCFVELGSEKQAAEAVQQLNGSEFQAKSIVARPMKEDFTWGPRIDVSKGYSARRHFYDDGVSSRDAAMPLVEGRRMMLSVQTPGWGTADLNVSGRNKVVLDIIDQYFGKYGIEALGGLHPFYGDKKANPRLLCFIDFKTKQGADLAVAETHDTQIEGRKTWLQLSNPSPWRAHQIGKVDKALLVELQEKGLLPQETYEDKFSQRLVQRKWSKDLPRTT
ncbi:hypothetical protein BKA66DRAFT_423885 [Pyrenochaeta sp. MPI-SDFR-AT-0127]|nr:hypothetical protein BKA66DRAFT_423885 [Pyrenochaeta sp. MPI-SDFR-AT-0127]